MSREVIRIAKARICKRLNDEIVYSFVDNYTLEDLEFITNVSIQLVKRFQAAIRKRMDLDKLSADILKEYSVARIPIGSTFIREIRYSKAVQNRYNPAYMNQTAENVSFVGFTDPTFWRDLIGYGNDYYTITLKSLASSEASSQKDYRLIVKFRSSQLTFFLERGFRLTSFRLGYETEDEYRILVISLILKGEKWES